MVRHFALLEKSYFGYFMIAGIISIIAGIIDDELGLVLLAIFVVSAFLFALPIYGFGKLIQDVKAIRESVEKEIKNRKSLY